MEEVKKTRFKVLAGLAVIVVAIHVILIRVFVLPPAPSSEKKDSQPPRNDVKKTVPVRAPVSYRFFSPSRNPLFGRPLDYSGCISGDLPERIVPGSKGARSGIIVDMDTRKVLWEKNSRRPVPIASMTKMMTMLLVMEELERRPDISLQTPVTTTMTARNVPRTGVLYLAPGEKFTVQELMIGTAVKSANDAATQLAEYFGNSVPNFVLRMNVRARELGLKQTNFLNPCGLPQNKKQSLGSAADMVILGEQLLQYPIAMKWSNLKSSSIRNGRTVFVNTNKLVNPRYPGVDGLKTGYLRVAGSCLTFSVMRNNRRIMGCVTGFPTARARDRFCRRLIDWAYSKPQR